MLPVGRVAAAVQDHRHAAGIGSSGDPLAGGHAATPVDVGLQDVDGVVADRPLEGDMRVPMLARRERLPRQALAQGEVGV